MNKYVIITDSCCDLPQEYVVKNNVGILPMKYSIDNKDYNHYLDGKEQSYEEFYNLLRDEHMATTSQLNAEDYKVVYEPYLKKGLDILGIAFSSGLSGTYNSGRLAIEELKESYPDRKIVLLDTLSASMGQGLIVHCAVENQKKGLSLEDNYKKLETMRLNVNHWFTVSDIDLLKRGGRVSGVQAFIAKAVKIQPILHVSDEGKLTPKSKKIGRKKALGQLFTQLAENAHKNPKQTIFISHGDCLDEALTLKEAIEKLDFVKEVMVNTIGPVIGAHSGPGTMAIYFLAENRG